MLAGYVGSDPSGAAWLAALRWSTAGEVGPQPAVVPGGGLLAPRLFHLPDGTVTGVVGEPLRGPGEGAGPDATAEALWRDGVGALCGVDGQWALAHLQPGGAPLVLAHDPFGAYQMYYAQGAHALWFSTSVAALLAVPELGRERKLDLQAVHSFLVFSYVPAPRTLLRSVRCVPPHAALIFRDLPGGPAQAAPTFPLPPRADLPSDDAASPAVLRDRFLAAIERRVQGEPGRLAVALSGGLDSAAVAAGLAHLGHRVTAFHLRFTQGKGEEQAYADMVARHLEVPLLPVTVTPEGADLETTFRRVVRHMDQPYGDPVTAPLWLLNRAVSAEGVEVCFNGEGGDQLFAGWPNKAMFAAEVYGSGRGEAGYDRVDAYLRTFHHFYGEDDLYEPDLRAAAEQTDLRGEIAPHLEEERLPDLFARLRWTNYHAKGGQNIMPRAAALARAHGLRMQAPLFDLDLARFALCLPGPTLLKGTSEKDLFKRAVEDMLPAEVVRRGKRGMGAPATHWVMGPLRDFMRAALLDGLGRRGLVRRRRLEELLKGQLAPGEIRTRRVGEQLWQLAVLELWLQMYVDRR